MRCDIVVCGVMHLRCALHQTYAHHTHAILTTQMMLAWAVAFCVIHFFIVLVTELTLGVHPDDLSLRARAVYHLVFDVLNLTATCTVLRMFLRRWNMVQSQFFTLQLRPWWKWAYVMLCCLMFPALLQLASLTQVWPSMGVYCECVCGINIRVWCIIYHHRYHAASTYTHSRGCLLRITCSTWKSCLLQGTKLQMAVT